MGTAGIRDATGELDPAACYRVVSSRDRRFDGVFWTAVRTTGIYCRPSCPARTPGPGNVTFHRSAASAQAAGYRACKRCSPDATPGSPEWDVAADVAGRAMRLVADGVVDREGVRGLADRLGFTPRHLSRLLQHELGAGPLSLARARRATTARVLIEGTDLPFADVAFAAGFASVRQFNDTVREVYAVTPTALRGRRHRGGTVGRIAVRLPVRTPYAGGALLAFLARRAVEGVEVVRDSEYARTLRLPHGHGTVRLRLPDERDAGGTAYAQAEFELADLRDLGAATERTRRLLDADCDPAAVEDVLGRDALLGAAVRRAPGLRVPGHVDGHEVAVRAVLGQQVSVGAARTLAGRLVAAVDDRVESSVEGLTHLFPAAHQVAARGPEEFAVPAARARALLAVSAGVASGEVDLDRGADRASVRERLLGLPGIGPWTADYVAMRALGDPDRFLPRDTGTRDALLGLGADPRDAEALAGRWAPWRSYAQVHLWNTLTTSSEEQQ